MLGWGGAGGGGGGLRLYRVVEGFGVHRFSVLLGFGSRFRV